MAPLCPSAIMLNTLHAAGMLSAGYLIAEKILDAFSTGHAHAIAPMNNATRITECGIHIKAAETCLEKTKGDDISKCQFYLDILNRGPRA